MPQDQKETVPLGRAIGAYIFGLLQLFFRQIFRLIYGEKGESMPPITDPILLESATSLAKKIRNQEVSWLNISTSEFLPNASCIPLAEQCSGVGIVYKTRQGGESAAQLCCGSALRGCTEGGCRSGCIDQVRKIHCGTAGRTEALFGRAHNHKGLHIR